MPDVDLMYCTDLSKTACYMPVYKGVMKDDAGNILKEFSEKTDMDFQKWKLFRLIDIFDPRGELIETYIDGVEQFFDDTAIVKGPKRKSQTKKKRI